MRSAKIKTVLKAFGVLSFCILSTAQAAEVADNLPSNEVLIFVSFSMPMKSLQEWSIQAQRIHAPLVIRGLVNDSFLDTQKAVKQMIEGEPGGVIIDPRLFKQYQITTVPAVVVNHKNDNACLHNQSCWTQETFDVVTGDVGLESALQSIADQGDNGVIAQTLLKTWRQV